MGLADRVFNLAKSYVDKAGQRWDELDEKARQELESYSSSPALGAWERAQAKIDQTQAAADATAAMTAATRPPVRDTLTDLPPGYEPPIPQVSPQPGTVAAAYLVLGVPQGASFDAVKKAYDKLRERAMSDKFAEGSAEYDKARAIERRAAAAYMLLADTLKPADDRFDRLEI
ncbi:MAG TPA: hypothetical protein VGK19_10270 [Capsulimonadaceae bacterium]|jgi:DnaJ-domain-containing protein 1